MTEFSGRVCGRRFVRGGSYTALFGLIAYGAVSCKSSDAAPCADSTECAGSGAESGQTAGGAGGSAGMIAGAGGVGVGDVGAAGAEAGMGGEAGAAATGGEGGAAGAACELADHRCVGDELQRCKSDGSGFELEKVCSDATKPCNAAVGTCSANACATADALSCVGDNLEKCSDTLNGFTLVAACGEGLCDSAKLACKACISDPPEWQDFDGDNSWLPQLSDPRWALAPLVALDSLPVGGSASWAQVASVRAIAKQGFVYVLIQANTDDNGPDTNDFAYVGFSQGGLAGADAVTVNFAGTGTTIYPPTGVVLPTGEPLPTDLTPQSVTYYHANNATTDPAHPLVEPIWGGENDGVPAWLKGARWDHPNGGPRWAIALRIDLSSDPNGFHADAPTHFFFGANVHTSTGDVIVGNVTPKVGTDDDKLDLTAIPKRSTNWGHYLDPSTMCAMALTPY